MFTLYCRVSLSARDGNFFAKTVLVEKAIPLAACAALVSEQNSEMWLGITQK